MCCVLNHGECLNHNLEGCTGSCVYCCLFRPLPGAVLKCICVFHAMNGAAL